MLIVVSRAKSSSKSGLPIGLWSSLLSKSSFFFRESIFLTESGVYGLLRSGDNQVFVVRTGEVRIKGTF
jgi:hypothetical protein